MADSAPVRPVWVDLSTSDAPNARAFYNAVMGWDVAVSPDPQFGGYGMARVDGHDVAGIGPAQPGAPTAWSLYIGTDDAAALGDRVRAAGGTVVAPSFAVGDAGRMAVFQDPAGAFISAWQPGAMEGFVGSGPGHFQYAQLNARGVERAVPFYEQVFGWEAAATRGPDGADYTLFSADGIAFAGAAEMSAMVPPEVPSYWLVYFAVDDVDAAHQRVIDNGGGSIMPPMDVPFARLAIVRDPQGAVFALHQFVQR